MEEKESYLTTVFGDVQDLLTVTEVRIKLAKYLTSFIY